MTPYQALTCPSAPILFSTGFGGPRCRICPAGTWSPGGDKNQPRPSCLTCPKTTIGSPVPGSDNITDCGGCKAGFGWNDCRVCPPNTFSTGQIHSWHACLAVDC
jgi:hypothetical protein